MNTYFLVFVTSLFFSLQTHAARVESVQQNHIIEKSSSANPASAFLSKGTQTFTINLPLVQIDRASTNTGIHKTGVVYQLPLPVTASQLSWETVKGGYAAHIHLFSDQAKRLRYHLVFRRETSSIDFRIQGSRDSSPIGPINHTLIQDKNIWLPATKGNSADLEIFVDGTKQPEALDFSIDAVNVIFDDLSSGDIPAIKAKSLGLAMEQEFDLACWADNENFPGLEQAAGATAKIDFIKGTGSFTCTGTLLNDKGSTGTPWLTTAHHCISDQATANTIEFEWFFQATSCGGSATDNRYAKTFGGAQLLGTDFNLEASFLRLNKSPPNGVVFSGWDTDIQVDDLVWGVHHPEGDHTMVSAGHVTALLQTVQESTAGTHLLNEVNFIAGGTEPGSSGSGLFSVVNGSAYWKGTLSGGPEENYQLNFYSNFNSYYSYIKPWLNNTVALRSIECLLNWAEGAYSNLFSPSGAISQFQSPYTYRYYGNTNAYAGVSLTNSHVYYLGPDGVLEDVGDLSGWLTAALCQ
ncbi:MAG: serine protease [Methylococcales bacterium]|nr:serine protease [Methylococcales bacterium]